MNTFVYYHNDLIIRSLLGSQCKALRIGVICIAAFERDTSLLHGSENGPHLLQPDHLRVRYSSQY